MVTSLTNTSFPGGFGVFPVTRITIMMIKRATAENESEPKMMV